MCRVIFGTILVIFGATVLCEKHDRNEVGSAINYFGDDIYRELSKEKGNVLFSPFSLHSALSLLALGADGPTSKELLSHLYLDNIGNLKEMYSGQHEGHNASLSGPFNSASNVFVDKKYHLRESFKRAIRRIFGVTPQVVNFSKSTKTASTINKWVSSNTDGKIQEIVDPGSFSDEALVLLLNAMYFKGKWKTKFDKLKTIKNYVFHAPRQDVKCSMMVLKDQKHNILQNHKFNMLTLDLADTDIKITFILPNDNITEAEESLDSDSFFRDLKQSSLAKVELKIPKFKLESEFLLKQYLQLVGISDIFGSPDFSKLLVPRVPAHVSDVLQKTLFEINEEGATASAVTTIHIEPRSSVRHVRFILDKPFLFFLYDSKKEVILMRGRIETPVDLNK